MIACPIYVLVFLLFVAAVHSNSFPERHSLRSRSQKTEGQSADNQLGYDPAPLDDDVRAILSKLTLKQKIGQMTQIQLGVIISKDTRELNVTAVKSFAEDYFIGVHMHNELFQLFFQEFFFLLIQTIGTYL